MKSAPTRGRVLAVGLTATSLLLGLGACRKAPPEPKGSRSASPVASARAPAVTPASASASKPTPTTAPEPPKPPQRKVAAQPVASVTPTPGDPLNGKFDLKSATAGLTGSGQLMADIKTTKGTLSCELWPDKAPISVANFIGLSRGNRPWKTPEGQWVKKPLYDGTPFHRIIKGFMIQGGDPNKNGSGGPGYVIPDEIWEDAHHDRRGLLCMANRGRNTNGSQFFILDGAAPHLDNGYTILGFCSPEDVIDKIANSPTHGDKAVGAPTIESVKIRYATE